MKFIKTLFSNMIEKRKIKQQQKLYESYYNCSLNYPILPKLIILSIYLDKIGIKNMSESQYHMHITFNDNTTATIWNENKPYAWMSSGKINFSNGESLKWASKSPPLETLYKFKKFKEKNDTDITKYLPSKMLRKQKLQKLLKIKNNHR